MHLLLIVVVICFRLCASFFPPLPLCVVTNVVVVFAVVVAEEEGQEEVEEDEEERGCVSGNICVSATSSSVACVIVIDAVRRGYEVEPFAACALVISTSFSTLNA